MNYAQIARLLSYFVLSLSAWTLVPLVFALIEEPGNHRDGLGFGAAVLSSLLVGGGLWFAGRGSRTEFFRREALVVVGVAWLFAGAFGAIPLCVSGAIPGIADAWFESISGLTTTGATVLGTGGNPAIEDLPRSLLLWRSMLQWFGGAGVILVFTVLFRAVGVTGKSLLDSEAVGVSRHDERPRMQEQSRHLIRLYTGLTAAAMLGYWLSGLGVFDAACHAMTTMATGGFSTRNLSMGAYQSLATELVGVAFMFLAGVNFVAMISVARNRFDIRRLGDNPEFRAYTAVTLAFVFLVTGALWIWGAEMQDPAMGNSRDYGNPLQCLRDATFQVVSMMTSTGYGTCNFQNWPKPALYVLILCMLIGGSTGSTAGGLKVFRVLVCTHLVGHTLRKFIRPRAVQTLRIGDEVIPDSTVSGILTLLLLWIAAAALGTLILDLDPRLDPVSAFTGSVSMLGCTGPAITQVLPIDGGFELANQGRIDLGPYGGYGDLQGYAKIYLAFQMILGRLEILAPLVLLFPSFWRK